MANEKIVLEEENQSFSNETTVKAVEDARAGNVERVESLRELSGD